MRKSLFTSPISPSWSTTDRVHKRIIYARVTKQCKKHYLWSLKILKLLQSSLSTSSFVIVEVNSIPVENCPFQDFLIFAISMVFGMNTSPVRPTATSLGNRTVTLFPLHLLFALCDCSIIRDEGSPQNQPTKIQPPCNCILYYVHLIWRLKQISINHYSGN